MQLPGTYYLSWELNSDTLEEQQVLLTAELSCPKYVIFYEVVKIKLD